MKHSILFIDDEQLLLDSIKRMIRQSGSDWDIHFANNANTAYTKLHTISFSVIVADIMMPDMNGIDFLEISKEVSPLSSRILLTGNPNLEVAIDSVNRGNILKYISKPCTKDELIEAIRTGIKKHQEFKNLNRKAQIDGLTKLYNREFIENKLKEEIQRASRYKTDLTLLILDLDHFKKVNDNYGHLTGDDVLKKVSASLQKFIRVTDIIGRFGGEEFMIIFPHSPLDSSYYAAERFREKIKRLRFKNGTFNVTISGGLKQFSGQTKEEFIKQADALLYLAKKSGRDRIMK